MQPIKFSLIRDTDIVICQTADNAKRYTMKLEKKRNGIDSVTYLSANLKKNQVGRILKRLRKARNRIRSALLERKA